MGTNCAPLAADLFLFCYERDSRGARDSKIGKKWPESSRILDYILC